MRIVAGHFGGRQLLRPKDDRVRPTADRVREAWMSIIQSELADARVLDLFSGSGALGLEALSRGAASAEFVDIGAASIKALSANIENLGLKGQTRIHKGDAMRFVEKLESGAYDIIFADPPYDLGYATRLVALFRQRRFARILSVEHRADEAPEGDQTRRYGDTAITFCQVP